MIVSAPWLFDGRRLHAHLAVEVEAGRVVRVIEGDVAADVVLPDGILSPGLIDLHNNGAFGVDCATADEAAWETYISGLAAHGVTGVLPTIITAPLPELAVASRRVLAAQAAHPAIIGVHLEGPFLNAARRGAHQARWLQDPDEAAVSAILAMGAGLRLVTLAPELPGALAAIARLTAAGIAVSLGHTEATAERMEDAAAAGARLVTHVFNAQSPLSHRAPGAPGVALTDERLFPCLIADGVHVDPRVLRLAFAACPRAVAVTDSILIAGLEEGADGMFGGASVTRDARGAGVRADGTLAGAGITLDEGVRRLIAAGVPPETALAAATSRPADALGITDRGRIAPGARADLVWWSDDWQVRQVWLSGVPQLPARAPALERRPTVQIVSTFLAKEAAIQPALAAAGPALAALADAVAACLAAGGRLFYVGAGTSGRLGLLDAVECGPTFGVPPGVIIPILAGGPDAFLQAAEGAEDDTDAAIAALTAQKFGPADSLVGIAASGATPFTLAAVRHAAALGAVTGAIVNAADSPIAAAARHPVTIDTGAEIIAGSTRLSAGTAQKIALNTLSSTIMIRLNKTFGPYMVDMRPTNAKLRARAIAITRAVAGVDEPAAAAALAAAGMHVKTAIVMLRAGCTAGDAKVRLDDAKGSLRTAIEAQH
jgi:N-acetylmuramic acid 6-phosphate etherase/N-acetylglucosamine-6-phosphate deacetylase